MGFHRHTVVADLMDARPCEEELHEEGLGGHRIVRVVGIEAFVVLRENRVADGEF